MNFLTYTLAALSLTFSAEILEAEAQHAGLQVLTIPDVTGNRPLDGLLWYPTTDSDPVVMEHGSAVWASMPVIKNAAPVSGKHPLVVLSHGMYGNARNQAWLATALAQSGYYVAAINHPGTTTLDQDAEQARQLWRRPQDISRAIDVLLGKDYGGQIDPDRILMAGHSLGGFTAIELAGGRYDPVKVAADCAKNLDPKICGIFQGWHIGETTADAVAISADLSDPRIKAFAVFDLGGTQTFAPSSLAIIKRPMLIYGAPRNIHGLNLDLESRALVASLPVDNVIYHEPETLAHFDFLGECTNKGLAILTEEEPDDAFVCQDGTDERRAEHAQIIQEVKAFFGRF